MPRAAPQPSRLDPLAPSAAEAAAIKALFNGTATQAQQQRAMEFICIKLCGARRISFDPSSARISDFHEGMRWVAVQLTSIRDTELKVFKQDGKETENG